MRPCLQLAPLFSLLACTQAAEGPRDAGARLDGEARLDSGFLPDAGTVNPCDGVTCRATDECMDGRCVDVLCLGIVWFVGPKLPRSASPNAKVGLIGSRFSPA